MLSLDVLSKNFKTGGKGKMRLTKKISDTVLKVVERIVWNEVEKSVIGGTPKCSAIYHQPKRPKTK